MKTRIHSGFFPPPAYLLMQSVGLDISDQSIKYAGLHQRGSELTVSCYGKVAVPPGIIVSGKIQDPLQLTEILTELRKKEHLSFVRASLPEEQLYLFDLHIPAMPLKHMRDTIELSLEEHVPIKAGDAVFDYAIKKVHANEYDVKVSAVPSEVAEMYYQVFRDAGLMPLSFELEAESTARAVIQNGDQATSMVVDFGQTRTGVSIVNTGIVVFSTTIDIGGQEFTKAIQKALDISFEEAEQLKRTRGLSRVGDTNDIFPTLLNSVSIFRDEINKQYMYWHTHPDDEGVDRPKINEIVLCGGDAHLPGLCDYLGASLGVRVVLGNPWVNISSMEHTIPVISKEESIQYATALGLALRDHLYD